MSAEGEEKAHYLIYSRQHQAWWGANRDGYVVSIVEAGRYTRKEVDDIVSGCNIVPGPMNGPNEFAMLAPEALGELLMTTGPKLNPAEEEVIAKIREGSGHGESRLFVRSKDGKICSLSWTFEDKKEL